MIGRWFSWSESYRQDTPRPTQQSPAYQPPAAAGKQAKAIHDQRPALVKTVDRCWDRVTGAWDWAG